MRKLAVPALAVALVATAVAGIAIAGKPGRNDTKFEYAIGLWGDLPYSEKQEKVGLPNLIADMNADKDLAFTVHDGDLKAGSATGTPPSVPCDDALYQRALGWFASLEAPAMFTPGDNDWTDCDRTANGPFDPIGRLDLERQLFFSTPYSLGENPMRLEVQTSPNCLTGLRGVTGCPENRRWTVKGVTYATVNVQGTCNNLCSSGAGDPGPSPDEYNAREAANEQWIKDTFAEAEANDSAGVMIIGQADPGFDRTDGTRSLLRNPNTLVADPSPPNSASNLPDGFFTFLTTLRQQTLAFGKPVVYVHGDSHYFRIDKPFLDANGQRLESFTRVETFGDNSANGTNDVQWVKVLVDPQSRDVFAYQPQIVPANVVDHSAPPAPLP
jgi:hypothetical protein